MADIYSGDERHRNIMTLMPPDGEKWSDAMSVCGHPYAQWVAMVESDNRVLDIYDAGGK